MQQSHVFNTLKHEVRTYFNALKHDIRPPLQEIWIVGLCCPECFYSHWICCSGILMYLYSCLCLFRLTLWPTMICPTELMVRRIYTLGSRRGACKLGLLVWSCAISSEVYSVHTNWVMYVCIWHNFPKIHIYTIVCLKSVAVRKLQVVILPPSPREISQTDRIVWKHILSRVRVSGRPRTFLYPKKKKKT